MSNKRELFHPGDLIDVEFGDFLPFISFAGLDPMWDNKIQALLERAYSTTGHLWRRGLCASANEVAAALRATIPDILLVPGRAVSKHYMLRHCWTEIEFGDISGFIVDPTGAFDEEGGPTLPYFGLAEHCKLNGRNRESVQEVYFGGDIRFF